jgi:excisionase family DNA binding protein
MHDLHGLRLTFGRYMGVMTFAQDPPEKKRTVEESFLTVRDVARLLRMSKRWVHERTRRREIPCYRFGTALRFSRTEILDWIARWREGQTKG